MNRLLTIVLLSMTLLSSSHADEARILTNQVGYNANGPKHAVILANSPDQFTSCTLNDAARPSQSPRYPRTTRRSRQKMARVGFLDSRL